VSVNFAAFQPLDLGSPSSNRKLLLSCVCAWSHDSQNASWPANPQSSHLRLKSTDASKITASPKDRFHQYRSSLQHTMQEAMPSWWLK
jgi:hypothetical protein